MADEASNSSFYLTNNPQHPPRSSHTSFPLVAWLPAGPVAQSSPASFGHRRRRNDYTAFDVAPTIALSTIEKRDSPL